MTKPIILCDVDGVLVDFAETYLRLLYELHGVYKTEADITSFQFTECVSTPEQDKAIWRHIERSPGLVYNLPVYDGAMDFLGELRSLGRVVACTSPANPLWTAERAQWLLDKGGFAKKDVVVASDKSLVTGDVLIDDAVHNLRSWKHGSKVLFARPWNRADREDSFRAANYTEVVDFIKWVR